MNKLPTINSPCDIVSGESPLFDAWFYTFKAENNIEHYINPLGVASHAQLCFMVALKEHHIYVPCSDSTFKHLTANAHSRTHPKELQQKYNKAWKDIILLCRTHILDRASRKNIINYCRLRFIGSIAYNIILPSRLTKRLITTFISQLGTEDPWAHDKLTSFKTLNELLSSEALQKKLTQLPLDIYSNDNTQSLRWALDLAELIRLIYLAAHTHKHLQSLFKQYKQDIPIEPFEQAEQYIPILKNFLEDSTTNKTFLYICDLEGSFAVDLAIAKMLLRLGHKIILSVKEHPMYFAPTITDMANNELLMDASLEDHIIRDTSISKNELLRHLHEKKLLIISDGTSEQLNLYRTSITFARAWKECDRIFAKGLGNKEVILETNQLFTRDILCFWEEQGTIYIEHKAKAPYIQRYSAATLTNKARSIIRLMRDAHDKGKSIMFYSCIIGSIPGETFTAIEITKVFIQHLRERLDDVFIINPAEYFEDGMDGDDLMYMWEQVQRSGLINVWRFQSTEDIETSFALMNRKIPPKWSGKDATFSTGCTKEMHIALDIQKAHPELQIIGPAPEKFFRRNSYGVGKFYGTHVQNSKGGSYF